MPDLGTLVSTAIPATITGLSGFLGAAFRFKQRLDQVEKDFEKYKQAIQEEFSNLKKAWRLELDDIKEELEKKIKELEQELKDFDDSFTRFQRASTADFANAEEMRSFIEEQQRQWQQIQRTLGQIEGLMQRTTMPPQTLLPTRR